MSGRIESRAARGALWSTAGFGASQVLRFASHVILANALPQSAFALMTLMTAFLIGIHLFSDFGAGPSIIQSQRGEDPVFVNTAFTMQAVRGFVLWLFCCAIALPFANLYNAPVLAYMLPIGGLTAIFDGLSSTKPLTANRNLNLGRLTLIDLISQLVGNIVMVAWALLAPTVWALVAGSVLISGLRTVLNHVALPGPLNRFQFDREASRQLLRFGRWIFISTVLTFFATQADRLVFGTQVDLDTLGVFAVAANLANMPAQAISNLQSKVIFPLFSHVHNAAGDLVDTFRRYRWKVLLLGGWAMAGLLAGGPSAVRLIYKERYFDAGWMLQIVAVATWFLIVESNNGSVLLARGQARMVAGGVLAKVIGLVLFIPLGFVLADFPGALWGVALAEFFHYAFSSWATRREQLHVLDQDIKLTLLVAVSGLAGWLAARSVREMGAHKVLEALVVFVVTSLFWLPSGIPLLRQIARKRKKSVEVPTTEAA